MPMSPEEKDDLKAQLAASRKKTLNFGLCVSTKPEECAMLIHRTKAPEILAKKARKIGGSAKITHGLVDSKGKLVMLTCFEEPPAGSIKRLKAFFKLVTGDMMKVQLLDPNGGMLEGDVEEDGEAQGQDQTPANGGEENPNAALMAGLKEKIDGLKPKIKEAIAANPKAKDPVQMLMTAISKAGAQGNQSEADKRVGQLQDLIAKVGAASGAAAGLSLVKLGKARLEWPEIHTAASSELKRLKAEIQNQYSDMPQAAGAVTSALKTLDDSFALFNERLHDQLDEVLNAEEDARGKEISNAKRMIASFSKHVDSDPIIAAIDGNDILPDTRIAQPIRQKLAEISAALGG